MPALTTNTEMFSSPGASAPYFFNGTVSIGRRVNFGVFNTEADTEYELISTPKGFIINSVSFREIEECGASGNLTISRKSNGGVLMTATAIGDGGTGSGGAVISFGWAYDGEIICLKTSAAETSGVLEVIVHGYSVTGESADSNRDNEPGYLGVNSSDDNASLGDPALKKG